MLSSDFSTQEFDCQCTYSQCQTQRISKELIYRIQKIRDLLNDPVHITSGFRCRQHQLDLAQRGCETAKGISQHELGNAADIVSANLATLKNLVEKEFKSVGISRRFFHVDLRDDKKRYWTYKF